MGKKIVLVMNMDKELDRKFREKFVRKRGDLSRKMTEIISKAIQEAEE